MKSTSDHSGLVGWDGEVPQHGDQLGVVVDGVDFPSDRIVVEVEGLHLRDSQDIRGHAVGHAEVQSVLSAPTFDWHRIAFGETEGVVSGS